MNEHTAASPLKVGYLMQNGAPDLGQLSGPQLHILAVINGFRSGGHEVRTLATQGERVVWSDDLRTWDVVRYGRSRARWFRLFESAVRRVQSELQLPFVGAFDSDHFADACCHHLGTSDLLYERHGYMGYGGVLAARRLGIPHVLELNGNIVKEIDEMGTAMSATQRRVGRLVTKYTLMASDHVVVVSEALKRELMSALDIPSERISVVLNGVHLELFSTRPVDTAAVRAAHRLLPGPCVLFVGSFQPWHGVDLLVTAFASLRRDVTDAQLVLIGDGDGRDVVERQVHELGLQTSARLLGRLPQEQVAAVMAVADVVVAPYPFKHSDIVGTPLKLLEYMAAGKAIVATTAPIHEVVQDGVTGIRVAPADPAALAAGISGLLADEARRTALGANARQAAQDYSWERVVQRLCGVFRGVLAEFAARKRTA